MDGEEEDGMHRYQRKLPFVDIIESLGGSAKNPPGRPRGSGARLRGSGGRIGATTAVKRRGMLGVRARQLRILIMGAAPGDRCCWLRE